VAGWQPFGDVLSRDCIRSGSGAGPRPGNLAGEAKGALAGVADPGVGSGARTPAANSNLAAATLSDQTSSRFKG
jgi:hypothetical protein